MNKVIIITLTLFAMVSCKLFNDDSDPPSVDPPEEITDIAIVDLEAPDPITAGSNTEIRVVLENEGNTSVTDSITVTLVDETDDETIGSQTFSGLTSNDTNTITFHWDTEGVSVGEHILVASHNVQDDNTENNSLSADVTLSEQSESDAAITSVSAPDTVTQGDQVDIEYIVANNGSEDITGSFEVEISNESDGMIIHTENIDGLTVEEEQEFTYTWNTEEVSAGNHEIVVSHTFDDDFTDNNSQSVTIYIAEEASSNIDLTLSEISTPDSVLLGEDTSIDITISNSGDTDITDDITVSLTDETDDAEIDSEIVNGLDAGEETTVTFTWSTNGASTGDHDLVASHDFADDDESNNSETATVTVYEEEQSETSDLSITVTDSPEFVTQGDTAFVDVEIENLGEFDISQTITISLTHHGIEEAESVVFSDGLTIGSTATFTLEWATEGQTTGAPPHPIVLSHNYADDFTSNNSDTTYIQVDMPE